MRIGRLHITWAKTVPVTILHPLAELTDEDFAEMTGIPPVRIPKPVIPHEKTTKGLGA